MSLNEQSWREFFDGKMHVALAKALYEYFVRVVKASEKLSAIEINYDLIESKSKEDLSDVCWLLIAFKIASTQDDKRRFFRIDQLPRLFLRESTQLRDSLTIEEMKQLRDTTDELVPLVHTIKYYRNRAAHNKVGSNSSEYSLLVSLVIARTVELLEPFVRTKLTAIHDLAKEIIEESKNVEEVEEAESSSNTDERDCDTSSPEVAENQGPMGSYLDDDEEGGDEEEELLPLEVADAVKKLRKLKSEIRKKLMEQRIFVSMSENILQEKIIGVITANKCNSIEKALELVATQVDLPTKDLQLQLFADEINAVLERTIWIQESD